MTYTKEYIQEKLSSDVRWMERAVIVLFDRQTDDEQVTDSTVHQNGRGFNGTDSRYLTYVSKYLLKGGRLTGPHVSKVGRKLPKYWRQILEEIELKQQGV
jgi:hypothetical protein